MTPNALPEVQEEVVNHQGQNSVHTSASREGSSMCWCDAGRDCVLSQQCPVYTRMSAGVSKEPVDSETGNCSEHIIRLTVWGYHDVWGG